MSRRSALNLATRHVIGICGPVSPAVLRSEATPPHSTPAFGVASLLLPGSPSSSLSTLSTMAHYHHGCSHSHAPPQAESPAYPKENHGPGAKWIKHLTQNRLGTFNGGHFSDVNLSSVLFTHRIDNQEHVKLEVWSAPGLSKPSFEEAMKQKFRSAKKGESFGPSCKYQSGVYRNAC